MNNKLQSQPYQRELFGIDDVARVYKAKPDVALTNAELYRSLAKQAGVGYQVFEQKVPIGQSGQQHSVAGRQARWFQQSLRRMNVVERVKGERGVWRLTESAKRDLHQSRPGVKLLGYSTALGLAIWGDSRDVFSKLDVPVVLAFSSPPYALRRSRAYGNPDEKEIVSFICDCLEPIVRNLTDEGSLVLNVTNDIFMPNTPARSTYLERLVLTIADRFELSLMERLVWANKSKAPGPIQWASKTRQQLNVAWEPVLIFCRSPNKWKADNRRVLKPHSDKQLQLIASGGEKRSASYSDGSYKIRPGSFGNVTAGAIPKNVLEIGQRCRQSIRYNKACDGIGVPRHGAGMPFALPEFLIQWLTEEGDLCVDPWAGRGMVGLAAEMLGRRWIVGENQLEYIRGGAELFRGRPDFWINPAIQAAY